MFCFGEFNNPHSNNVNTLFSIDSQIIELRKVIAKTGEQLGQIDFILVYNRQTRAFFPSSTTKFPSLSQGTHIIDSKEPLGSRYVFLSSDVPPPHLSKERRSAKLWIFSHPTGSKVILYKVSRNVLIPRQQKMGAREAFANSNCECSLTAPEEPDLPSVNNNQHSTPKYRLQLVELDHGIVLLFWINSVPLEAQSRPKCLLLTLNPSLHCHSWCWLQWWQIILSHLNPTGIWPISARN